MQKKLPGLQSTANALEESRTELNQLIESHAPYWEVGLGEAHARERCAGRVLQYAGTGLQSKRLSASQ
eukprot:scaffold248550_cov13-Tisochrysis_lutea.AAC.1